MKKLFAIILSLSFILGSITVTANAADSFEAPKIEFIFEDNTPVDIQQRIISDLSGKDDGTATCNILCDLLGHKFDTGTVSTITHKVRATDPRCLREIFNYEICSRCDHSNYTLIDATYISCC